MKIILLALISILGQPSAWSQNVITDPKGNFIFGVPTTTFTPELASSNIGIQTPIRYFSKTLYYIVDEASADTIYTMAKSKVAFIKGNAVNNSKSTLIFNNKTNYSPSLELGFSWGFDSLMNPSAKAWFYMTYSVSVFGEYQNFHYYDTISQTISPTRTNRISPGIRANTTVFRGTAFALSFGATYQNAINTDKLTSYQKMTNTFYVDNNISSNGLNEGYLAPVDPVETLRLSVSAPQFWVSGIRNKRFPFALTPYYYVFFSEDSKPNNNVGVVFSLLGDFFRRFDTNDDLTYNKKARYKFAQAFNIGYNFVSTGNKDPKYFFVSGTFSLAAFKAKKILPKARM